MIYNKILLVVLVLFGTKCAVTQSTFSEKFNIDLQNYLEQDIDFYNFLCISNCDSNSVVYLDTENYNYLRLDEYLNLKGVCGFGHIGKKNHPFEAGNQFNYFKTLTGKDLNIQYIDLPKKNGKKYFNSENEESLLLVLSTLYESDERYWQEATFVSNLGYYFLKVLFVYDKEFNILHRKSVVKDLPNFSFLIGYSNKASFEVYKNKVLKKGGFMIDFKGEKTMMREPYTE